MKKNEMKPEFVSGLGLLLAVYSRHSIRELVYHKDKEQGLEMVEIMFDDGSKRCVNVTNDSVAAIMQDIARVLIY